MSYNYIKKISNIYVEIIHQIKDYIKINISFYVT